MNIFNNILRNIVRIISVVVFITAITSFLYAMKNDVIGTSKLLVGFSFLPLLFILSLSLKRILQSGNLFINPKPKKEEKGRHTKIYLAGFLFFALNLYALYFFTVFTVQVFKLEESIIFIFFITGSMIWATLMVFFGFYRINNE